MSFTDYDYRIHDIYVESLNDNVFCSLDDVIISSVD